MKEAKPIYLVIHGSYQDISLGLYTRSKPYAAHTAHAVRASSQLLPLIDELLVAHNVSLNDLSFIALDQGPGAFTSLRVVVTTMNGIAFAKNIPLVGCDGLEALATQMQTQVLNANNKPELVCALLNAYNNEVYYHMRRFNTDGQYEQVGESGYAHIDDVCDMINAHKASSVWCAGNGSSLHREILVKRLGDGAHIDQVLHHASIETFAAQALTRWQSQDEPVYNLQPQYLKTQSFVKAS